MWRNQEDDIHVIYKSPKFMSFAVKSSTADSLRRSLFCDRENSRNVKIQLRKIVEIQSECSVNKNYSSFLFVAWSVLAIRLESRSENARQSARKSTLRVLRQKCLWKTICKFFQRHDTMRDGMRGIFD